MKKSLTSNFSIFKAGALLGGVFLFSISLMSADEIILESGKPLSGKIIAEDSREVSIITADNMVIHLDRSIIKRITRSKNNPIENTFRVEKIKRPKPSPVRMAPQVKPGQAAAETKSWKSGVVEVTEIYMPAEMRFHPDSLSQPLDVKTKFSSEWSGISQKQEAGFSWKSMVIRSTSTKYSLLDHRGQALDKKIAESLQEQLNAEQKIQNDVLHEMADAFSLLQAPTENELREKTNTLFDEFVQRADKRRKGLRRIYGRAQKSLQTQKK